MHKFSFLPTNLPFPEPINVLAYVGIEPRETLALLARRVEGALDGIRLQPTERFDEFPAYAGEESGLEIAILGPPAQESDVRENPADYFQLQLSISPVASLHVRSTAVDISQHLANYLSKETGFKCWPLE